MSQCYPDINSPQFGQQARATIVGLVLAHLPLGIDGRKIDDRLAWDILCYAPVKRISIESACDEGEVRRGAAKSGATHFHMYATLAVVHSGQRFTLAMTFVWAGETMDLVLARLLKRARELGVRFKRLYCDKGFCSVAVLRLLRQRRVPYLIPIPARGGAG